MKTNNIPGPITLRPHVIHGPVTERGRGFPGFRNHKYFTVAEKGPDLWMCFASLGFNSSPSSRKIQFQPLEPSPCSRIGHSEAESGLWRQTCRRPLPARRLSEHWAFRDTDRNNTKHWDGSVPAGHEETLSAAHGTETHRVLLVFRPDWNDVSRRIETVVFWKQVSESKNLSCKTARTDL